MSMTARLSRHGNGRLRRTPSGRLARGCGASEPPAICHGSAETLQIASLAPLAGCGLCTVSCASGQPWDGTLHRWPGGEVCLWTAENEDGYGSGPGECLSLDGAMIEAAELTLTETESGPLWTLAIYCRDIVIGALPLWIGSKTASGSALGSASGTYNRISGCADALELTIV